MLESGHSPVVIKFPDFSRHFKGISTEHGCIYIFFWIPYWPQILLNILRHPLDANQYGGHIWQTGSIFSCCKGLWDCLPTKPITTKHQSVFWLVSQSRRMSAIFLGSCRGIHLLCYKVSTLATPAIQNEMHAISYISLQYSYIFFHNYDICSILCKTLLSCSIFLCQE